MFVYNNFKFFRGLKKGFLFCSFFLFILSAEGKREFLLFPSYQKPISLELQNEYYFSNLNYTQLGKYTQLPKENYFLYHMQDYTLHYSPFQWISIETGLTTHYGKSRTREVRLKNFALTQWGLGFSFLKKYGAFHWNWDFKSGIPLTYNTQTNSTVILGDEAFYLATGMWFAYGIIPRSFYVFAHSNFKYRTNQLSSLFFNQLGLILKTKYIQAGVSADAFLSFPFLDGHSSSPRVRWDTTDQVNGGSYKFLSVNPGSLSFSGWLKWNIHPFSVLIYANKDTYGTRYGKGFAVGGNLTVSFNTQSKKLWSFKKIHRNQRSSKTNRRSGYFSEDADNQGSELQQEINQLK